MPRRTVLVAIALVLAACSDGHGGPDGGERERGPVACMPSAATADAASVAEDPEATAEDVVDDGAVTDVVRSGDGSVLLAFEVAAADADGAGPARSAWELCSPDGERVATGLGPATRTDGRARLVVHPLDDGFLVTPEWGSFAVLTAAGELGRPVDPAEQPPARTAPEAGDRVLPAPLGPPVAVRPATGAIFTPTVLARGGDDGYVPGVTPDAWGISADGRLWGQFGDRVRVADGDRWRAAGSMPGLAGTAVGLSVVAGSHLVAMTVDSNLQLATALHVRQAGGGDWVDVPLGEADDVGALVVVGEDHVLVPREEQPAVLDVAEGTLEPLDAPGEVWASANGLVSVEDGRLVWSPDGGDTWTPVFG